MRSQDRRKLSWRHLDHMWRTRGNPQSFAAKSSMNVPKACFRVVGIFLVGANCHSSNRTQSRSPQFRAPPENHQNRFTKIEIAGPPPAPRRVCCKSGGPPPSSSEKDNAAGPTSRAHLRKNLRFFCEAGNRCPLISQRGQHPWRPA